MACHFKSLYIKFFSIANAGFSASYLNLLFGRVYAFKVRQQQASSLPACH
jgi:hypothetical protein